MRTLKVILDGVEHEVVEGVMVVDEIENARTVFDFNSQTGVVGVSYFDNDDPSEPIGEELIDLTEKWETADEG
jgi:hypothetical protein